eukprot:5430317-Pleurochrysis_carterae.AAC.2
MSQTCARRCGEAAWRRRQRHAARRTACAIHGGEDVTWGGVAGAGARAGAGEGAGAGAGTAAAAAAEAAAGRRSAEGKKAK